MAPPSPTIPDPTPCPAPVNLPYRIGLMSLIVTQVACNGTWTTTAWSTAPALYIHAQARSPEAATQQLLVMQTLRATVPIP